MINIIQQQSNLNIIQAFTHPIALELNQMFKLSYPLINGIIDYSHQQKIMLIPNLDC
jgi:hypothetical protein